MKRNVLILLTVQFGYHTDTYMYCKYLDKSKYNVHYICFDMLFPKMVLPGIDVIYVPMAKNRILRYFNFITELRKVHKTNNFHLIFHIHTKFTILIRIFSGLKPIVLDIRSGDLSDNIITRRLKNLEITLTSWFYSSVSVISESLAKNLKISRRKQFILPLGGEISHIPARKFDSLNLLYVGTLEKRNIHLTILGLSEFLKEVKGVNVTYDIVGPGNEDAINAVKKAILETNLQNIVHYHGRKDFNELIPFFDRNNIGIVFVPQTVYFDSQPSTKLFECALAGMFVIATNTNENRKSLYDECGVIVEDNPGSFAKGLEYIYENRQSFDSEKIKSMYKESSWEYIVKNRLEPYFESRIKL